MIKRVGVKKKVVPKKIIQKIKKPITPPKRKPTEKVLIENFIALQKVNTNLAIKFDKLSNQISSLLELFEMSAKTLAEKDVDFRKETRDTKQLTEKVDSLLEQNRTIARGVAMIHETPRPRQTYPPQRAMQNPLPPQTQSPEGYQKSIPQKSPQQEFKQLKRN